MSNVCAGSQRAREGGREGGRLDDVVVVGDGELCPRGRWPGGQTHVLFVPVIIQRDLLVCRNWVAEDTAFHYLPSPLGLPDQPCASFTALFTF